MLSKPVAPESAKKRYPVLQVAVDFAIAPLPPASGDSTIEQLFCGSHLPAPFAQRDAWRNEFKDAFRVDGKSPEAFKHYVEIDPVLVPVLRAAIPMTSNCRDEIARWATQHLREKQTNHHSKLMPTVEHQIEQLARIMSVVKLVGHGVRHVSELAEKHAYIVTADLHATGASVGACADRLNVLAQVLNVFDKKAKRKVEDYRWRQFQKDYIEYFQHWPCAGKSAIATYDHSLSSLDLTIDEILAEIPNSDSWVADILQLIYAFGLRIAEATRSQIQKNWLQDRLHICLNAMPKGRRIRDVMVTDPLTQIAVMRRLLGRVEARGWGDRLYPENITDVQAIRQVRYRFNLAIKAILAKRDDVFVNMSLAKRTWIRVHDLRHDFIFRSCRQLNLSIPVLGEQNTLDDVAFEKKSLFVMLQVGHGSPGKIQAYIGRVKRERKKIDKTKVKTKGKAKGKTKPQRYEDRDMSIWSQSALFRSLFSKVQGGSDAH